MSNGITFSEYQAAAHDSSLLHQFSDPQQKIHDGFLEETTEVFYDIGDAVKFAYLFGYKAEVDDETKIQIAKEAGDALWYVTESVTSKGESLGKLAASVVARHTDTALTEPSTIADFDKIAATFAANYRVINFKLAASLRSSTYSEAFVAKNAGATLQTNPGYVLQRVFGRLRRKLSAVDDPSGPASNIDFESDELIEQSTEDFLWVVSGLAQAKLGMGLAAIAQANLTKLARRKAQGTLLSGYDPDRS